MNWHWPQYVDASLLALGIIIAAVKDGEPRTGKHQFGVTVVAAAIAAWILYCGGFWTP